jgi:hypothetical protein
MIDRPRRSRFVYAVVSGVSFIRDF